jgi:hypothetical protein
MNLTPVTILCQAPDGSRVQLYETRTGHLVGGIRSAAGTIRTLNGPEIRNGLNPLESADTLLGRLKLKPPRKWQMVVHPSNGSVHVWPRIEAAAKNRDNFKVADSINPFANLSLEDCAALLEKKGFERKYWDRESGASKWYHPERQRGAYLDPGTDAKPMLSGQRREPPHIDMSYRKAIKLKVPVLDEQGNKTYDANNDPIMRLRTIEKVKFPLNSSDPDWIKIARKTESSYVAYERSQGRDGITMHMTPTMQKGGVEFAVNLLKGLSLEEEYILLLDSVQPLIKQRTEKVTQDDVSRIMSELFKGYYICNQIPSLSMDSQPDQSIRVSVPSAYHGTLVERVLREIDAVGKAVMMGITFSEESRRNVYDALGRPDQTGKSSFRHLSMYKNTNLTSIYKSYGVEPLPEAIINTINDKRMQFEKSCYKCGDVQAVFTFIPTIPVLCQRDKFLVPTFDLEVAGSVKFNKPVPTVIQEKAERLFAAYGAEIGVAVKKVMASDKNLSLFYLIGFQLSWLRTMDQFSLAPDLLRHSVPPIVHQPEDWMPPYIDFRDQAEGLPCLHGAVKMDFHDTEVTQITKDSANHHPKFSYNDATSLGDDGDGPSN